MVVVAIRTRFVIDSTDNRFGSIFSHPAALGGGQTLAERLRAQHEKIFARPSWATKAEVKARDEETDKLMRKAGYYLDRDIAGKPLPANSLEFSKCPQMNKFCFQRSSLSAVQFHPSSEIAMLAHQNGVVTFLSVDAKECKKIQSVFFKNFELSCAKLSHDGMDLLCGSGRRRTLHCYNLLSGNRSQVVFPKGAICVVMFTEQNI